MELNAEQIIKALECCTSRSCGADCPYYDTELCQVAIMRDALALIKELTEENERLRAEGEWDVVYEYNEYRRRKEAKIACSVCGHKPKYEGYLSDMNFCPNCGAKMKGGAE